MIDFNSEYNSFNKINKDNYINKVKSLIDNENIEMAINSYNEALSAIKVNNDDIASIQLKKALTWYPEFIEAKVLLALYEIKLNETEEAITILKEVQKDNVYSFKANKYLNYINEKRNKKVIDELEKKKSFSLMLYIVLSVIAGIIIGFVFSSCVLDKNDNKYENQQINKSNNIADNETVLKETEKELQTAKKSLEALEKKVKESENTSNYYKNVSKIIEAENFYNKGEKINAAQLLLELKSVEFKEQEKIKFEQLYNIVTNEVSTQLYNEGYSLYTQRKYDEALEKFKESLKYNQKFKYANRSLYYAGRCFQIKGDNINASMYFKKIINSSNKDYSVYAQRRLNEIN